MIQTTCLINQKACGREAGNSVCTKCGMDERVVYPGQADLEAAQERAELRYLRAHVKQLEDMSQPPPSPNPKTTMAVGQVFRDAPWAPEMVVLPSGRFLMGNPVDERGQSDYEGSQHNVVIGYKLAIGKYPVTFEEWDVCVADGGTQHKADDQGWGRGKRPVINVSWDDTQNYVAWLNKKLGIAEDDPCRYRLPSESEWEYACRAGTTTAYWWGNEFEAQRCNANSSLWGSIKGRFDSSKTLPVDALGAASTNEWGLSGTHGNVWEWVQDCWNASYQGAPSDGGVSVTGDRGRRVLRGGSWYSNPQELCSTNRDWSTPGSQYYHVGFRLARTVS